MPEKTINLTPAERANVQQRLAGNCGALQGAVLAAQLACGQRLGLTIRQGRVRLHQVAYAIGTRSGRPTGVASMTALTDWVSGPEILSFLTSYAQK